jgi:hypothetical protein
MSSAHEFRDMSFTLHTEHAPYVPLVNHGISGSTL